MHKLSALLLCLTTLISVHCDIPPSPNFDTSNFTGDWNVAALFSTTDMDTAFYSCATVNITNDVLTSININLTYIEAQVKSWTTSVQRFVPDPLNKAILISSISPKNNLIVTYYDSDAGQAVLINPTSTFGLVLSRSDDPNNNNFDVISGQILTNLSIPLSNVTYIFNQACSTLGFQDAPNFNPFLLGGTYYANALFALDPSFKATLCLTIQIQGFNPNLDITTNLIYQDGQSLLESHIYLPKPRSEAILINTEIRDDLPYVFIYEDDDQQAYLAVNGDGSFGFLFSKSGSISTGCVCFCVTSSSGEHGLNANTETFYLIGVILVQLSMDIDKIIY